MNFNVIETAFGNPALTMLLYQSMKEYRDIEKEFKKNFEKYSFFNEIEFKSIELSDIEYFEKNFFSIFFISIFKKIGFEKSNLKKYGMIFHVIRVMVTATDNILDNEEKGKYNLKIAANPILKNILLIIMSEIIMCEKLKNSNSVKKMVETLYNIAKGESISALKKGEIYPKSEFIREEVHKNIGGELLGIAFDIPLEEESELKTIIENFRRGIVYVGNALQALDDMTDVKEDIDGNKANLMTAIILEKNGISYENLIEKKLYGFEVCEKEYSILIEESVENALKGFKIMEENGYPINKKQGEEILKMMFKLRGLEKEWKIYQNKKGGI